MDIPTLPQLSLFTMLYSMLMAQGRKMKGQLGDLPASAISIVVLVIVVAMGVLILVGMNDSTTDEAASDVISEGISGLGTYSDWFATIILVVIAIVILSLVMGFFYLRSRSGGGGRA